MVRDVSNKSDRGIAFSLCDRSLVEAGQYIRSRYQASTFDVGGPVPEHVPVAVAAGIRRASVFLGEAA